MKRVAITVALGIAGLYLTVAVTSSIVVGRPLPRPVLEERAPEAQAEPVGDALRVAIATAAPPRGRGTDATGGVVTSRKDRGRPSPGDGSGARSQCASELRLVALVHCDERVACSRAYLSVGAAPPSMYAEAQRVSGYELVAIHPEAVILRSASGEFCSVHMFGRLSKMDQSWASSAQSASTSHTVQPGGEARVTIGRELVAEVLAGGLSWIDAQDGAALGAGVVLHGVPSGSVLARLGLQSGDVLHAVNGYALNQLDSVRAALTDLVNADEFLLGITRHDAAFAIVYKVERPRR